MNDEDRELCTWYDSTDGKSTLKIFMRLKQRKGSGKKHTQWMYVTSKKETGRGERGGSLYFSLYTSEFFESLKVLLA